jgi:DNA-binding Lrp family transcriptional regulator
MVEAATNEEQRVLRGDLKQHGQREPVVLVRIGQGCEQLLDGRTRLDLQEANGDDVIGADGKLTVPHRIVELPDDAAAISCVLSLNLFRRHLTPKQKRELIDKLLKAMPEKSNRQIAKTVGVSHPHVAKVRKSLEKSGDVETVTTSVDTKGRKQPAKKTSKLIRAPLEPAKSTTASDLRTNIGPTSQAEAARLRAQVDELQAENRRREIETIGLKGEIEELKAARVPRLLAADGKAPLGCSFCGKAEHEVGHLIVNPFESRATVSICNECVELCVAIIKDRNVAAAKREHQPKQIETPDIPPFLRPRSAHRT